MRHLIPDWPRGAGLSAAAGTLLLAGCAAVGPDYVAPTLPTPAAWSRTDAVEASPGEEAARLRWWERFDDALLTQYVQRALRESPDVRLAQARLQAARAQRALADAQRAPSVGASAAAGTSRNGGATSEFYNAGFDASWELDVFGARRRALEAARADEAARAATLGSTRVTLAAEVARSYVEVRALQTRLAIARRNLASQSETLQLTEWRAQAGLVGSLEVEQARANRAQTRAQIPTLQANLGQARHRLAILLGAPPAALDAELELAAPLPSARAALALPVPAEALRQRPDVQAAERTLAAETARIGQAEAARYPGFNLSASIGVQAASLDALTAGGAVTRSIAAAVAAPVFDAGRLRQQVQIQTAVQAQALASYESVVLTALEEVENALVAIANSRARSAALAEAAQAARNAALLARQRYSSGLTDFQTVLDTERSVLSLEDSQASADADGVTATIQLYKALGGGWSAADPTFEATGDVR